MQLAGTKAADKTKLLSLEQLDGRTLAAKRVTALITEIQDDLGGADRLSAAEREIVKRAALAGAMLESMEAEWLISTSLDVGAYTALANVQRRLLTTIGLERRPRDVTPDLSKYIASHAAAPAEPLS